MIDVEPLVQSELARLVPLPAGETADWEDVLRRSERVLGEGARPAKRGGNGSILGRRRSRGNRRRVQILVAVVLVFCLLGAVPALSGGGYGSVIHWLTGAPPKPVVNAVRHIDLGAPSGQAQHPIVGRTGKVYQRQTKFGRVQIWLTPTRSGGFCESFVAPDRVGSRAKDVSGGCFPAALFRPIELTVGNLGTDFAPAYIEGRLDPRIVRLELAYVNGERENVPIQNGFFATAVDPVRTQQLTDHPERLVGYGSGGQVVATQGLSENFGPLPGNMERPPVAEVAAEQAAISVSLTGANAVLYLSPSRLGGSCARLAAAGTNWAWSCADPGSLPNPLRVALARVPDRSAAGFAILLYGVVRPKTELEFRYQDGTSDQVPLDEENFLVALPSQRWQPGQRLTEIDTQQGSRVSMRIPVASHGDAFYEGGPDRTPQPPTVQIQNPPGLPIVARQEVRGEQGEKILLEVKRQTSTHWYEVLSVDGKIVVGENLQWFPGGREPAVEFEGLPLLAPTVPHDLSLLIGDLRHPASAVRVIYRDGPNEQVPLTQLTQPLGGGISGYFIYDITQTRRSKQPLRFEALDQTGKIVGEAKIPAGL